MSVEAPESPEEEAESLELWLLSKPTRVPGTECASFASAVGSLHAHLLSHLTNPNGGFSACPLTQMDIKSPQAVAMLSSLKAGPCFDCKGIFSTRPFTAQRLDTVDLPQDISVVLP